MLCAARITLCTTPCTTPCGVIGRQGCLHASRLKQCSIVLRSAIQNVQAMASAGKSTLLDILAGRKAAKFSGQVWLQHKTIFMHAYLACS